MVVGINLLFGHHFIKKGDGKFSCDSILPQV